MKFVYVLAFLLCIPVDISTSANVNTSTIEPSTPHKAGILPSAPTVTSNEKKEGGLKCYRCSSTKDWDECEDIEEEYDCADDENQCYKLFYSGKKGHVQAETYMKGCTSSDKCKNLNEELCKMEDSDAGDKCEITWCTGDLCNAAALPMASVIIFVACACLAFLY